MPAFILDLGSPEGARTFASLDDFTQGYIEAAFFTDTGTGDDEELEGASFAEIASESLARIIADCAAWQHTNMTALALAYASCEGYGPTEAGRDYWFTRNGHGVGFWDRACLARVLVGKKNDEPLGDVLSARCRNRPVDLYRGDDGQIYFT